MPSKYYTRNFQPNHFYHVFNRGAAKQDIFLTEADYLAYTSILKHYLNHPHGSPPSYLTRIQNPGQNSAAVQVRNLYSKSKTPVKLVSYCLMPNHFHLLLKQTTEDKSQNISNLMRRVSITYSMYFNSTHNKSGAVFQGKFKNVHIASDEQLLHTSKYIHLNPKDSLSRFQNLESYPFSSYPTFVAANNSNDWIHTDEILKLDYFSNSKNSSKSYKQFISKTPNPTKYLFLS